MIYPKTRKNIKLTASTNLFVGLLAHRGCGWASSQPWRVFTVRAFNTLKRQRAVSSSVSAWARLPIRLACRIISWGASPVSAFRAGPGAWVLTAGFIDSLCFCVSGGCLSLLFCVSRLPWATGTDLACCWRRLLVSGAAALALMPSVPMAN